MKNKLRILLAMVLMATTPSVQAEITPAATMKEVQAKIEAILETTKACELLVAFDIDMTLTQPNHPAVYYPNLKKYREVYKEVVRSLTPAQRDLMNTLTTQVLPQKLVEKDTPGLIRTLQNQGVRLIAFTATLTGQVAGYKEKMIFHRRDQLQKMGIDFTKTGFPYVVSFMDIPNKNMPAYAGWYPMLYHSVLSSNGEGNITKGQTLVAFLNHVGPLYQAKVQKPGFFPKVIVLIDDRLKNLKDVEDSLQAYDPAIQFIGIEYGGAYAYAPQDISKEDFQQFWKDLAHKAKAKISS